MIKKAEAAECLRDRGNGAWIDVRSPEEFRQGHIPGAIGIPLFTDAERAEIGTLYVRSSREAALLRGLDIALPKTRRYIRALNGHPAAGDAVTVYCWRGGLRSTLMAEVFVRTGRSVRLVVGGYKALRRQIREDLTVPRPVLVVGGLTGSGKTGLLHRIAGLGGQVIDLEALASHKGSVFGGLGQPDQPTNEQFENDLHALWMNLDPAQPVWLEDESRMIGRVTLPEPFFRQLSDSPLILADTDRDERVSRLVEEYAGYEPELLATAILRISERLGGARTREALEALAGGRFPAVAGIALDYYDKAYTHSLSRRPGPVVGRVPVTRNDLVNAAAVLIETGRKYCQYETDLP